MKTIIYRYENKDDAANNEIVITSLNDNEEIIIKETLYNASDTEIADYLNKRCLTVSGTITHKIDTKRKE